MRGFYAGGLTNLTRCILRNIYRYPLMMGLPAFYRNYLPQAIKDNKQLLRLLTGFSIAMIESTLTCPIERLKVYFMTAQHHKGGELSYKQFFQENSGKLSKELFRGFTPLVMRQAITWTSFLQVDLFVKQRIRSYYQIPT